MKAWHFLQDGSRLRDGRVALPDGAWMEHEGPVRVCHTGLHASVRPSHALLFAPRKLVRILWTKAGKPHFFK